MRRVTPQALSAEIFALTAAGLPSYQLRMRMWLLAGVLTAFILSGCGECVFDEQVRGIVRDSSGAPIAGATVTTCDDGNRCDLGGTACRSVVTASDGSFELSVEQCSPSLNQCELRPIAIAMDGCTAIDAQPVHNGTAVLSFELACT